MKESEKPSVEKSNEADAIIISSLAKLDSLALGISLGTLCGLTIFIATVFLIYKGGEEIGPNLELLSQYFIGFEVTERGSVIGLIYGFFFGFFLGALIAFLRNSIVGIYLHILKVKGHVSAVNDFIDNP